MPHPSPTDELDSDQRRVAHLGACVATVAAGPGTGKTRTLVARVRALLASGVPSHKIVVLTFSRRAAREASSRLKAAGHDNDSFVGTFHGLAAASLGRSGQRVGLSDVFRVVSRDETVALMAAAFADRQVGADPSALTELLSSALRRCLSVQQEVARRGVSVAESELHFLGEVYGDVMARKAGVGVVDFDDLLLYFRRLLLEHPNVAPAPEHVLVDELQDCNPLQLQIVELLARNARSLVAFGDPQQSIYGFRGACGSFSTARAWKGGAISLALERNYRSAPAIVEASGAVIERPQTSAEGERAGRAARLVVADRGSDEASFVCHQIEGLLRTGTDARTIAVLCRMRRQMPNLADAFVRRGLAFVSEDSTALSQRSHSAWMLGLLRSLAAPNDVSRLRAALAGLPGMTEAALDGVMAALRGARQPSQTLLSGRLMRRLPAKAQLAFRALAAMLNAAAEGAPIAPAEVAQYVVKTLELRGAVCDDLERIVQFGRSCETLEELNNRVSLLDEMDAAPEERDAVMLCTIHQAKGREWDHVFVVGANDSVFPGPMASTPEEVAEERRVLYVAMTRARLSLTLSWCQFGRRSKTLRPSRFLEVPHGMGTQAWPSDFS